jgi:hypothetical protein
MTRRALPTALLVVIVTGVVSLLVVAQAFELASADLSSQIRTARGQPADPRTQPGIWIAERLAADLAVNDLVARDERETELDQRGDRLREMAGVASLVGLLLALVTARASTSASADDASKPLASTTRKGSA